MLDLVRGGLLPLAARPVCRGVSWAVRPSRGDIDILEALGVAVGEPPLLRAAGGVVLIFICCGLLEDRHSLSYMRRRSLPANFVERSKPT